MLRLDWISPGDDSFGTARVTTELIPALGDHAVHTRLYLLDSGEFYDRCQSLELENEVLQLTDPHWIRKGTLFRNAKALFQQLNVSQSISIHLQKAIQSFQPHAIVFQHQNLVSLVSITARRSSIPAFWLMPNYIGSGYPFDINKHVYGLLCRLGNITPLANSKGTATSLGGRWITSEVLSLGANPSRFDPTRSQHLKSKLNIPDHHPVFGMFARLVPEKGHIVFWKALLNASNPENPCHFLVCGDASDTGQVVLDELRAIAAQHQAENRLHWIPATNDPTPWYGCIDVAVNPRLDPEPFGLSVVEAMLMKKPVLAHRAGGPGDIIQDQITGWLAPEASISSFTHTIQDALKSRSEWIKMGLEGRNRALNCYTIERVASNFHRILTSKLNS
ncbi:MAG: glycosyltransferase family 4 protein [Verrucomicrobiota bacterium]